jgi:hypothetical protein
MGETTLEVLRDLVFTCIYFPLLLTGFDDLIPENSKLARRLKKRLDEDNDDV